MRRIPRAAVALAAALLIPAPVRADGGFFFRTAAAAKLVTQPRQEAVIARDGPNVTVVVRSSYDGDVDELAGVYPVPAVVTAVREAEESLFQRLDAQTAPVFMFPAGGGRLLPCFHCGAGGAALENRAAGRPMVRVEAEGVAGMYEWKCLSSTGADALLTWLKANDYAVPEKSRTALDHYIRRRMFFLAFRVRPRRKTGGAAMIHPVAFSYRSASLVYPMVISRPTAAAETEVLLYVVGRGTFAVDGFEQFTIGEDEVRRDEGSPTGTTYESAFRRHVRDAGGRAVCREAVLSVEGVFLRLRELVPELKATAEGLWITRLRTVLAPEAMDRDFVLRPTGEEPETQWSRYHVAGARAAGAGQVAAASVHFVSIAVCSTVALRLGVRRRRRRWHRWAALGAALAAVLLFAAL